MTTVSGTFTAKGVSGSLATGNEIETISFSFSGTYNQTLQVERAVTPDGSAWEIVAGPFSTANATVTGQVISRPNDKFRVRASVHTSGTSTYSLVDEDVTLQEFKDRDGNVIFSVKQSGVDVTDALTSGTFDEDSSTAADNVMTLGHASVSMATKGDSFSKQCVITLTDTPLTVTDALAYGSQLLFTFPDGRIQVVGVTSSLAFAVTSDRASTINDDAALDYSLGTAAASATTLATTMVNLLPKQDHTLDGTDDAYTTAAGAALASGTQFDGTTTAVPCYLNVSFPTGTDIDADGTMTCSGTITVTWHHLGDY